MGTSNMNNKGVKAKGTIFQSWVAVLVASRRVSPKIMKVDIRLLFNKSNGKHGSTFDNSSV